MRRAWANLIDALMFLTVWYVAGMAMCQTGCGDAPNPCDQCPKGSECRRKNSTHFMVTQWECVVVVKTMESLSVDGAGSGGGQMPGGGQTSGPGGIDGGE